MKCTQLCDISDSHLANYIFLGLETSNSVSETYMTFKKFRSEQNKT